MYPSPKKNGVNLFKEFSVLLLEGNKRCEGDTRHQDFLADMRNFDKPSPITDDFLKSLKILSEDDVRSGRWNNAPIFVSSNRER